MNNSSELSRKNKIEEALRESEKRCRELLGQTTELKKSNEDLEKFIHIISHDLKEPLRSISNFTQLFHKKFKGKTDPDSGKYLDHILSGTDRMNRMIDDLLIYSRITFPGQGFTPVDFNEIVREIIEQKKQLIKKTQTEITVEPLPTISADELQIRQLFENLIGNAMKFHGDKPPRINISAARKDEEFLFTIKDRGIGFKPEYAERIFLIFQRLHTYREYPGTGIGLAICKKIVEHHHGRIWAESKPEEGTGFYFSLPPGERNIP